MLITERGGTLLRRSRDGRVNRVAGVPPVFAQGQGGLFDVLVPRDFAKTRALVLSYAKAQPGGAGTAVAVAGSAETAVGCWTCARFSSPTPAATPRGISAGGWWRPRMALCS